MEFKIGSNKIALELQITTFQVFYSYEVHIYLSEIYPTLPRRKRENTTDSWVILYNGMNSIVGYSYGDMT